MRNVTKLNPILFFALSIKTIEEYYDTFYFSYDFITAVVADPFLGLDYMFTFDQTWVSYPAQTSLQEIWFGTINNLHNWFLIALTDLP